MEYLVSCYDCEHCEVLNEDTEEEVVMCTRYHHETKLDHEICGGFEEE